MVDPCWLLEDAFLLILPTTADNEHGLVAVEAAATLDVAPSSFALSADSSSLLSCLFVDVLVRLSFLFLFVEPFSCWYC